MFQTVDVMQVGSSLLIAIESKQTELSDECPLQLDLHTTPVLGDLLAPDGLIPKQVYVLEVRYRPSKRTTELQGEEERWCKRTIELPPPTDGIRYEYTRLIYWQGQAEFIIGPMIPT